MPYKDANGKLRYTAKEKRQYNKSKLQPTLPGPQKAIKKVAKGVTAIVRKDLNNRPQVTLKRRPVSQQTLAKVAMLKNVGEPKLAVESAMKDIMCQITAPAVCETVRLNSAYTTDATAIARPVDIEDVAWPNSSTTATPVLNPDEMFAALYRDPVRHTITYDANTNNETSIYHAVFVGDPATGNLISRTLTITSGQSDLYPVIAYFIADSANLWNPHGNQLGSGVNEEHNGGYYVNKSDVMSWVSTALPSGGSFLLKVWKLEGKRLVLETQFTVNANTTTTFTPSSAAYRWWTYNFISFVTSSSQVNLTFTVTHSTAIMATNCMISLDLQGESVESLRILGSSMMYSNTTANIYKCGEIVMAQVPPEANFDQYLTYSNVTAVNGSIALNAETGEYGFLRPNSIEDFDWIDFNEFGSSTLTAFEYPVIPKGSFLVCFVKTQVVTNPQVGRWTFCDAVEYLTDNKWIEKAVPTGDLKLYEEAVNATKVIPQFHENPLHMSDIMNAAKRVVGAIVQYGPIAIDWASKIAQMIA